jgi:hypothetical protein
LTSYPEPKSTGKQIERAEFAVLKVSFRQSDNAVPRSSRRTGLILHGLATVPGNVARFAALWIACTAGVPADAQFTFTSFSIPGAITVSPSSINNNGDVAGEWVAAAGPNVSQAFIRSSNGTLTMFDPLPGVPVVVTGINDLGEVAGYCAPCESYPQITVFVRDSEGGITTFSTGTMIPSGFNNSGEMLLWDGGDGVYLRSQSGALTRVPPPPNLSVASVDALNNSGQATVTVETTGAAGVYSAVVNLTSDQYTVFGYSSSGAFATAPITLATGLNDSGYTAGTYAGPVDEVDFVRNPDGSSVDSFQPAVGVGSLGNYFPVGINNSNQITGAYATGGETEELVGGFIGNPLSTTASPPVVTVTGIDPGPPETAVFSIVDPIYGLTSFTTRVYNCAPTNSPWTPGQTTPVTVSCTKEDADESAVIAIEATNSIGLITDFDPVMLTVSGRGSEFQMLSDIPPSEHVVTITNGNPGLQHFIVKVNGRVIGVSLSPNQKRTLNLSAWMKLAANSVGFSGEGPPGASAGIILQDGVIRRSR